MYETLLMHSRADRALRVVVAKELENFELTMMEWLLLATVCSGPPVGHTMTSVAQTLDVTLPQVTALMNKLTKRKLLKQKVSSHDRRSRRLTCTPTGSKMMADIEGVLESRVSQWLQGIPAEQLEAYQRTVGQIAELDNTES
jgi:DNA-binding MarR family transcriptional regulator